jgi:putative transposase
MAYWQCYYHIIWATKYRQPLIEASQENLIYATIAAKSRDLNCPVLAINGMPDHIHVAVSIPPGMAIAAWVGQVKGSSSHIYNAMFAPETKFVWQEGYGVLSFGQSRIEYVRNYIARQKQHHTAGTIVKSLERSDD